MNKWLADFAYRTGISWWVFAIAAIVSIAIAFVTISTQAVKAAMMNPVKSLTNRISEMERSLVFDLLCSYCIDS
jgi:hypothetical protein